MITKKTKYALKALGYLAEQASSGPILISELAEAEEIPRKFLEAILVELRKGGVLQSRIGKGGGYMLAAAPNEITLARVVTILEGGFAPVECLNASGQDSCAECGDPSCCGIRLVMGDVKNAIAAVLEHTTLADMVERSESARKAKMNIVDFSI